MKKLVVLMVNCTPKSGGQFELESGGQFDRFFNFSSLVRFPSIPWTLHSTKKIAVPLKEKAGQLFFFRLIISTSLYIHFLLSTGLLHP
ncbi:MAG: hypothetical protein PHF81_05920 [Flavobacterium sp.]|nr:hypothetical protein [Flavobacterium sp.]